jgi:hypothetical protein
VERWASWLKWIAPIGIFAAVAVLYFFPAELYPVYPRCLFHALTGLDCPGCGSIRSVQRLLHGDFTAAFRFNPLLYSLVPAVLLCRRHLHKPPVMWSFVAGVVVFAIARNL